MQPSEALEDLRELQAFLKGLAAEDLKDETRLRYLSVLGRVSGLTDDC